MNRQQMMAIMATMGDDALIQALSAVGIEAADEGYDMGEASAEGLEPWNARDVSVEDANKPPLFDKSKIIKPPEMQMQRPQREYLADSEPLDDEMAEYALHTGM